MYNILPYILQFFHGLTDFVGWKPYRKVRPLAEISKEVVMDRRAWPDVINQLCWPDAGGMVD